MIQSLFIGTAIGFILGICAYFVFKFFYHRNLLQSLQLSLFLVKVPKIEHDVADKDFKNEIALTEQLLSNLASLQKPFVFEIAVPHVGEEIRFYIAMPRTVSETVIKQVQGLWNGASVEPAKDDYSIFNASGVVAAAYVKQKEHFALPVRTYTEIGADTFAALIGAFSKVNEIGEGAALQLVIRPAPSKTKKAVYGHIEAMKRGDSLHRVLGSNAFWGLKGIIEAFNPPKKEDVMRDKVIDEDGVKAFQSKIAKPLFEVNVRILASAPSPFQANNLLDGLIAGLNQLSSPTRNEFKFIKQKNPKKISYQFSFRTFDEGQVMILNTEEIASFYHFPISTTETPRVKWLKSKEAAPPANLSDEGTLLGHSVFRGETKPVYITDDDRRRHIYIIGQTGTGKSTLLGNMLMEDINSGKGLALIDPHGELTESALSWIPKERVDDLIYFNPADLERPLGLNMLDYNIDRPEEKTFIVNEMQSIFNKLFSQETMGPMFEQYMRNALLLLMEDMPNEEATLTEVPRIFTDAEFRKRKLARIRNPVVIDFWEKEAVKAGGEASLANMTPYITSKFNNFISNDYMRPIIGQPHSAFNFRSVMDEGKILLINLSKGKIGDINASLLGMVFTGKILMAALSRVDIADASKRKDFNLYIDEFQNFTTDSIATILSEARKYRLTLTMAHQFIAQLNEKIRDAVFGNVGSQIIFRVGAQDTEFLAKQFEPTFSQKDLMSIDNLNAYAKLLIQGETSKPFNIKMDTASWVSGRPDLVEALKEYSRVRYGMKREVVEEEIYKRLRT